MSPEARTSSTELTKLLASLRADHATLATLQNQVDAATKEWRAPPGPETCA